MITFQDNYTYSDPLNIVFLCGSHYSPKNLRDKRTVTKKYIESHYANMQAVILERNFHFANTTTQYLSYDEIFLKGLAQVEQLASLYANKVIIIHETVSTAAELGMFAINPLLAHKICLLVPDDVSVEENKIGKFIELAFLRDTTPESKVHLIRYYPDTEINRTSSNKCEYYTYYHEDRIGRMLGAQLDDFLLSDCAEKRFRFTKSQYGHSTLQSQTIDYHISSGEKYAELWISIDVLKVQLLSMFSLDDVRKELRKEKEIHKHVSYISGYYQSIMCNTIEKLEGQNFSDSDYEFKITLKDSSCDLRQAIGYFIFMLQAANLISLVQTSRKHASIRKVQLSVSIDKKIESVSKCIEDTHLTEFGREIL